MTFLKRLIVRLLEHTYALSSMPIVYRILPPKARRKALYIYFAMLGSSFFELAVVAFIGIFVANVTDPGVLLRNSYVVALSERYALPEFTPLEIVCISGLAIVAFQSIKTGLRLAVDYSVQIYAASIDAIAGEKTMQRILSLDYQDAKTKYNQSEIFNFIGWRTFFGSDYLRGALQALQNFTVSMALCFALLIAYPFITLLSFGLFGAIAISIYSILGPSVDRAVIAYRDGSVESSEQAGVISNSLREIKLAGMERQALMPFSQTLQRLIIFRARQNLFLRTPYQLMESCGIIALVVIVIGLATLTGSAGGTTATAAVFAVASLRILATTNNVVSEFTAMRLAVPYLQRLNAEFSISSVPELPPPPERGKCFSTPERVEFDKVCFRYPGATKDAIHSLSFTWEANTSLGIIGLSGAGKSTLIDVLSGLFAPTGGEIRAGSENIHGRLRRAWMQSVGYIAQSPFFFPGTLEENIALPFAQEPVDRERVLAACKLAHIDFLDQERGGLEMSLVNGGANLSGGQKQRLAIARALYQDAPFIIMDEPTSAMDIANESLFTQQMATLMQTKRVVIISHKINTVRCCDNILWLEKGEKRMFGKPEKVIPAFEEFVSQYTKPQEA